MIARFIEKQIVSSLKPGKVVCLMGARRTGKTVLMNKISETLPKDKILMVYGQDLVSQERLSSQRVESLKSVLAGYKYLFIDEAQYIPNIGTNLKIIVDTIPISVFVTGSSAFDLKNKVGEPLVGRGTFLNLYPISQKELSTKETSMETAGKLEERLIFGGYPDVVIAKTKADKITALEDIRDGYLLKDVLSFENIKDSVFILKLLRLIAFQIGHDISYAELAQNLNTHPNTVRRYLELLEKVFIIFPRQGYSRNLRKEYTKTPRYYFWDNGIRNIIISNLNDLTSRDDVGALWENYCVVERAKRNKYQNILVSSFYWRTYDQKEIDLIEEREGKLFGYEMKWKKDNVKAPKDFLQTYKNSGYEIINKENYLNFIL